MYRDGLIVKINKKMYRDGSPTQSQSRKESHTSGMFPGHGIRRRQMINLKSLRQGKKKKEFEEWVHFLPTRSPLSEAHAI